MVQNSFLYCFKYEINDRSLRSKIQLWIQFDDVKKCVMKNIHIKIRKNTTSKFLSKFKTI